MTQINSVMLEEVFQWALQPASGQRPNEQKMKRRDPSASITDHQNDNDHISNAANEIRLKMRTNDRLVSKWYLHNTTSPTVARTGQTKIRQEAERIQIETTREHRFMSVVKQMSDDPSWGPHCLLV